MDVVDRAHYAPGVCFICEQPWADGETRFVDTRRDWDPGGWTHLNGRKYLCEHCVDTARKLLFPDLVPSERVDAAVKLAMEIRTNLEDLNKALKDVAKVADNMRKEVVKDVAGIA